MKKIGVYICNYNGKDYTVNCIKSLKKQNLQDFDIYVVDNASTDGTIECLREVFQDVAVYKNESNLGGAGGFDRGLREGIKTGYEYIVLLDNDVLLAEDLISNMYDFLVHHKDVGIVGAKVMIMDLPDTIQDYGDYLDFEQFKELNDYTMEKDGENIPDINECDYVPTCAVMIRREALMQSGTMPADNFIYYDDIELSHKMRLNGWRVIALGNAKVWHKGGFRKAAVNTFSRYYFLRNRLNFFAKYVSDDEIDNFIETMLSEVFSRLYGFHIKQMHEILATTQYAFDDFLHSVRGKAADYKIMSIANNPTPFEKQISGAKNIKIIFGESLDDNSSAEMYPILMNIMRNIQKVSPQDALFVSLDNSNCTENKFWENLKKEQERRKDNEELPQIQIADDRKYDLILQVCEHVSKVTRDILPVVYVDKYCNCIASQSDYKYFTNSVEAEEFFKATYRPLMRQAVMQIRSEKSL